MWTFFLDLCSLPRVPCVLVLLIYLPPEKAGGKFINRDAGYTAEYLQDIRCQRRPLTFSNFIGVKFSYCNPDCTLHFDGSIFVLLIFAARWPRYH
jgi:hypothetical protein